LLDGGLWIFWFEGEFFEPAVEDRYDEHSEYFNGHSAEGWDCHRHHNVGATSGRGEHGYEGEESDPDCDAEVYGVYLEELAHIDAEDVEVEESVADE